MEEKNLGYTTIEEYIALQPEEVHPVLRELWSVIRSCVPEGTEEKISWRMPTFALYGNLIHFAAFKNHVGLYPGSEGVEAFADRLEGYKNSKGAIQFPFSKPMPYDLIRDIVKYRVSENIRLHEEKKKKQ